MTRANLAVAAVDRTDAIVLTICGQTLPVTDWADAHGVVGADPVNAPVCSAGPDAHDRHWQVDVRRLVTRAVH